MKALLSITELIIIYGGLLTPNRNVFLSKIFADPVPLKTFSFIQSQVQYQYQVFS